jgi:predicted  nucleic acid-binding Zn-ribbon protein
VTTARSWWRRGDSNLRAEAQAAKDAAAEAFYELDTAQRDLEISIETISAVDDTPEARRALAGFRALGEKIDQVSGAYIATVDAHDLDRDELDHGAASSARAELTRAKDDLVNAKTELERFQASLAPLLGKAETQLARLAPARERAKQSLLAASNALDAVRAAGLKADDLAARLATLAPELTKLNEGASKHGVKETVQRADEMRRTAEAVRAEAERLPEQAREIDKRLVSLRTRVQGLGTRAEGVAPVLSQLRRRFSLACWQDLQQVPEQAAQAVRQAEDTLAEARRARTEQRWADATARLATVRALMDDVEGAVAAAGDRLRKLNEVSKDPKAEVEKTRFVIRDAQRLAMQGRSTPEPRHARPLDDAVARLDRALAALEGRHPDYWAFLTETAAVRETANRVVSNIREDRAAGR